MRALGLGLLIGLAGCLPANAAAPTAQAEAPAVLKQVFTPDMIGAQVAYLERITGPAWRVQEASGGAEWRLYKVGSCVAEVAAQGGEVVGLAMEVSPRCTFDLAPFAPNAAYPAAHRLTFGDLADPILSRVSADCLRSCGNAADPEVHITWEGPRADGFRVIRASAVQVADPVLEAADKWEDAMIRARGEDWVISQKFNCSTDFQDVARSAFKAVRVERVQVDGPVEKPICF